MCLSTPTHVQAYLFIYLLRLKAMEGCFTSISGLFSGFSSCICSSRVCRSCPNSDSVSGSTIYSIAAFSVVPRE